MNPINKYEEENEEFEYQIEFEKEIEKEENKEEEKQERKSKSKKQQNQKLKQQNQKLHWLFFFHEFSLSKDPLTLTYRNPAMKQSTCNENTCI